MLVPCKDYVVQKRYPQDFPGSLEPVRQFQVLRTGFDISRWMIVGTDYGGRPVGQGIGKNFPGVYNGPVKNSLGNHTDMQNLMSTVHAKGQKVLLEPIRPV